MECVNQPHRYCSTFITFFISAYSLHRSDWHINPVCNMYDAIAPKTNTPTWECTQLSYKKVSLHFFGTVLSICHGLQSHVYWRLEYLVLMLQQKIVNCDGFPCSELLSASRRDFVGNIYPFSEHCCKHYISTFTLSLLCKQCSSRVAAFIQTLHFI